MRKLFLVLFMLLFTAPLIGQDTPLIGEIKMFAGNFAPRGWAFCDGQLLSISQFQSLFSILGTTYGGDGVTTFALPDLRGRTPIHAGHGPGLTSRQLGEKGGSETVILTINEMPAHTHNVELKADSSVAVTDRPQNSLPARNAAATPQYGTTANISMSGNAVVVGSSGGNFPHPNMQPYATVNYIIALEGIYPSRD